MKRTIMLWLTILCAAVAFGQGTYRIRNTILIYEKPDLNSVNQYVDPDNMIELSTKTGSFWQATYKNRLRFMHESSLANCVLIGPGVAQKPSEKIKPILKFDDNPYKLSDSNDKTSVLEPVTSAGDELYAAGKTLLSSTLVGIGGGALSCLLIMKSKDPTFGVICGIGAGIYTLVFQIVGYRQLMKAGERLNIGPTSAGIGMTINLNPGK